jgi:hypothetical protein
MATLETQYKNFLLENPNSKFTFEEWKEWLGKQIGEALKDIKEKEKSWYPTGSFITSKGERVIVHREMDKK